MNTIFYYDPTQPVRRMSASDYGRKGSLAGSLFFTLVGFSLCIAAILTPSWQVVNLREYNSIHEHGLWLDCTRHSRDGYHILERYNTVTEPLHCVYKFDYDKYSGTFDLEDDNSPVGEVNRHKFYGWHTATLIMLGLSLITATISIMLGLCGCCYRSITMVYTVLLFVTTLISSIAEGVFFFYSHRADNRFIKGIVGTYEQRVGVAFFLEMGACFAHFLSFIIAMLATYFSFSGSKDSSDHFSSSRTNMTNLGRSMEFDPMMYPPQTPQSVIRPYSKQEEDYNQKVAESMPELGMRGAFPSDFFPRVRRKSETCV